MPSKGDIHLDTGAVPLCPNSGLDVAHGWRGVTAFGSYNNQRHRAPTLCDRRGRGVKSEHFTSVSDGRLTQISKLPIILSRG